MCHLIKDNYLIIFSYYSIEVPWSGKPSASWCSLSEISTPLSELFRSKSEKSYYKPMAPGSVIINKVNSQCVLQGRRLSQLLLTRANCRCWSTNHSTQTCNKDYLHKVFQFHSLVFFIAWCCLNITGLAWHTCRALLVVSYNFLSLVDKPYVLKRTSVPVVQFYCISMCGDK